MGITADDFENPPPSSLDKAANRRVRENIRRRKGRSKEYAPEPEEAVLIGVEDEQRLQSRSINQTPATTTAPQTPSGANINTVQSRFFYRTNNNNIKVVKSGGVGVAAPPKIRSGGRNDSSNNNSFNINNTSVSQTRGTTRTDLNQTVDVNKLLTNNRPVITQTVEPTNISTRTRVVEKFSQLVRGADTVGTAPRFTAKEAILTPVILTSEFTKGFIGAGVNTVKSVTVNIDQTLQGVSDIFTGETTVQDIGDNLRNSFRENPARFAGEITFDIAGANLLAGGVRRARNIFVAAGSERLPTNTILSSQNNKMPVTSSTAETIRSFERTRTSDGSIVAVTASSGRIKGGEAGLGRKGSAGLEDPGIYVTPVGEGSEAFLRINNAGSSSFSLNPVAPFIDALKQPTLTTFKAKGIQILPSSVTSQPGFTAVRKFFETRNPDANIFVTKRSQIGQGEIPRQRFVAPEDFTEGNFNIKKGDIRTEAGTTELEAVVPFKQEFVATPKTFLGRIKGFDSFIRVDGVNVPIRPTELIAASNKVSGESLINSNIISGARIARESSIPVTPSNRFTSNLVGAVSTNLNTNSAIDSDRVSNSELFGTSSNVFSRVTNSTSTSEPVPNIPFTNLSPRTGTGSSSSTTVSKKNNRSSKFSRSSRTNSIPNISGVGISKTLSNPSRGIGTSNGGFSNVFNRNTIASLFSRRPVTSTVRKPLLFNTKDDDEGIFKVQTLKKGKFVTIGTASSKDKAANLGIRAVNTSALRTFRVLKGTRNVKIDAGANFRRSKSRTGATVEKSKIAINTPGELKEISPKKRLVKGGFKL